MRFLLIIVFILGLIGFVFFFPNQTNDEKNMQTQQTETLLTIDSLQRNHDLCTGLEKRMYVKTIKHHSGVRSHFMKNQVTVDFYKPPGRKSVKKLLSAIDGHVVKKLDSAFVFSSRTKSTAELVDFFREQKNVSYAEPNYLVLPNRAPNDRLYAEYQWNLPAIGAEEGWNISNGSTDVIIAVIDTGVDLDHPDLGDRIIAGYNALAENGNADDNNGHGTHVAGIIASETNNGLGVAGGTWHSKIMPIKVMNADGAGTAFDVAQGIRWATDRGADVINLSLGNYQSAEVLKNAVQYALDHDVVVVSAAGNDNTNEPGYPAAYPGVLAVAAVGPEKMRAPFSNYGKYIDVTAPGVNIASTYMNGKYAALSGTSMAAPHVSALAGLIRSLDPDLNQETVVKFIKQTTEDLGTNGSDPYYGAGLINMENALKLTAQDEPYQIFRDWIRRLF